IVEGCGRRRYKQDFIKYLIYAQSSYDETISRLNMISELYFNESELDDLKSQYSVLGKRIYNFIKYV
ncbi:MAG TPA: four helix bundle protein, partial [Balneolaceae bacterium]|nr:four helix bundle protein [Balneolaceae bacterium]